MDIDKTTLADLSIFHHDDDLSLAAKFDLTRTTGGRDKLHKLFVHSLGTIKEIADTQNVLKLFIEKEDSWPMNISNGSVMMIYKFYETAVDTIPAHPSVTSAYTYRWLHGPDYGLVKYSAGHAFEFIKGMGQLIETFCREGYPEPLVKNLQRAANILDRPQFAEVAHLSSATQMNIMQVLSFAAYIRYHFKQLFFELIEIYNTLDAWYGMAMAVKKYHLVFPEFKDSHEPVLQISGLYHPMVVDAVPYNVVLDRDKNFVFLTGANMAGKSTFIKAVGIAVFLAHTGMGVPASSMKVTLFDGLLSNINVQDNVIKGESFFYNEVMRVKNTVLKVMDKRKWLILIDELFKGTNIQDAMKCSTAVVKGLIKVRSSLFILSTHLYEISDDLKEHGNIDFKYFETQIAGEELRFSYQLKEGVSNDRLGYFILQSEKVTDLLDNI